MTPELERLEGEPTDNSIDVIEAARALNPKDVFRLNVRRVRELLEVAWIGIEDKRMQIGGILVKLSNPTPDDDNRAPPKPGTISLSLTEEELNLLQEVMNSAASFVEGLPFYLHNVLCVAIWSALEGYLQATLAQVFSKNPDLMSSDKKISG